MVAVRGHVLETEIIVWIFFSSQDDDRMALSLSDRPHCGESAFCHSLGQLVTSLAAPSDNLPATQDVSVVLMWIYDDSRWPPSCWAMFVIMNKIPHPQTKTDLRWHLPHPTGATRGSCFSGYWTDLLNQFVRRLQWRVILGCCLVLIPTSL